MTAPERIHFWQTTSLSSARYYNGCKVNGAEYQIAHSEHGQPLVRVDVLAREKKVKRAERVAAGQVDLFGVGA